MEKWIINYNDWKNCNILMENYLEEFKISFESKNSKLNFLNNNLLSVKNKNSEKKIQLPKYINFNKYNSEIKKDIQEIERELEKILHSLNTIDFSGKKNIIREYNNLKETYHKKKNIRDNLIKYKNSFNKIVNNENNTKLESDIRDLSNLVDLLNISDDKFIELYSNNSFITGIINISGERRNIKKEKLYITIHICKNLNKPISLGSVTTIDSAKKIIINQIFKNKKDKQENLSDDNHNVKLIIEKPKIIINGKEINYDKENTDHNRLETNHDSSKENDNESVKKMMNLVKKVMNLVAKILMNLVMKKMNLVMKKMNLVMKKMNLVMKKMNLVKMKKIITKKQILSK